MSHSSSKGFTLIEIIVTVTIIAIIFSIGATGFNRMNSNSNLNAALQNMASDISITALSALHSDTFQLQTPANWGVNLAIGSNSYTVFADFDNDSVYDTNEKFKTVLIGRNISITSICFTVCASLDGALTFDVPSAVPSYQGTPITTATDDLTIELTDAISGQVKHVSVNTFGAVSIE